MAAVLGLDASLRPIGRPQALQDMQNGPILSPWSSQVASSVLLGSLFDESGEPLHASLQHAGNGAWCHLSHYALGRCSLWLSISL
jgi:hypothetical protein